MENTTLNANAQAVLTVLQATDRHPTALEVYEAVRRIRPHIGLATVYRILHQLTEQGLINALGRDNECRYDARIQRHDHAVCTVCGALLDIPVSVELSSAALEKAAQVVGIELDSHEVRIYGRCKACREQNK
jgi:Fur family peroxide stress response transcriptional regulator